jgi:hypothetical protein
MADLEHQPAHQRHGQKANEHFFFVGGSSGFHGKDLAQNERRRDGQLLFDLFDWLAFGVDDSGLDVSAGGQAQLQRCPASGAGLVDRGLGHVEDERFLTIRTRKSTKHGGSSKHFQWIPTVDMAIPSWRHAMASAQFGACRSGLF